MKRYILALSALAALGMSAEEKTDSVEGFKFTDVKVVPGTSVKDQKQVGHMLELLGARLYRERDSAQHRQGAWTLARCGLYATAMPTRQTAYVRMDGKTNFAAGGSVLDVAYVIDNYGIVPEEVYKGLEYGEEKHDHYELDPVLTGIVEAVNDKKGKKSTAWKGAFDATLDAYLGKKPETFTVDGKTYTPKSYAASLGLNTADFIPVTSYTHHPFYTQFPSRWPTTGSGFPITMCLWRI